MPTLSAPALGERAQTRLAGRVYRLPVAKVNRLTYWVRTLDGNLVKRRIRRHYLSYAAASVERATPPATAEPVDFGEVRWGPLGVIFGLVAAAVGALVWLFFF